VAEGVGWNSFTRIVAGSDGVLYGVEPKGTLLWYRHDGFRDGGGIDTWRGRIAVGSGWGAFTTIFSGGGGVIYAVESDGTLW
jgi:tachylectin